MGILVFTYQYGGTGGVRYVIQCAKELEETVETEVLGWEKRNARFWNLFQKLETQIDQKYQYLLDAFLKENPEPKRSHKNQKFSELKHLFYPWQKKFNEVTQKIGEIVETECWETVKSNKQHYDPVPRLEKYLEKVFGDKVGVLHYREIIMEVSED